jgi:NAD(P)-dependent dehydrogenase (short-subunit alcohol dehydrogenase family)
MSGQLPIEEDSLAGRVELVTGGTRGIGASVSLSPVRRGAAVAAGFSSNRGAAGRGGPGRALPGGGHIRLHHGTGLGRKRRI